MSSDDDYEDEDKWREGDINNRNTQEGAENMLKVGSENSSYKTFAEKSDFVAALEHIVTMGNKVRHDNLRFNDWMKHKRKRIEDDDNLCEHEVKLKRHVHADDVRLYGRNLFKGHSYRAMPATPWPKRQGTHSQDSMLGIDQKKSHVIQNRSDKWDLAHSLENIDHEWDREYGDNINTLTFAKAMLYRTPPSPNEIDQISCDNIMDTENSNHGVDASDVQHSMILRCWQRAVHAASCTIMHKSTESIFSEAKSNSDHDDDSNSKLRNPHTNLKRAGSTAHSVSQNSSKDSGKKDSKFSSPVSALEQWQKLGIPNPTGLKCTACQVEFETTEKMRQHFFGDKNLRGCCWGLIRKKQQSIVGQFLQNEVSSQVEGLLMLLFQAASASESKEKVNKIARSRRVRNYKDVLNIFEQCLDASTDNKNVLSDPKVSTVIQTLQSHIDLPPLVINKHVLQAARIRLEDRYVDIPK